MEQFRWSLLLKRTVASFVKNKTSRLGAALAFYTTFSIAPLLVMATALASFFFGVEAVQGQLKRELVGFVGHDGAEAIQAAISAAKKQQHTGVISSIAGIVALLFGAAGVFVELKDAMNQIWGVEAKPNPRIMALLRNQLLSFAMVLSVAFLLLVSMILSAIASAATRLIPVPFSWAHAADIAVSLILITLLFMLIFKYLPDVKIQIKDVWFGAMVTAIFFTFGKYLIGLYLGNVVIASAYGATGSLGIFLLWTYYSSQILFFGAELTQTYTQMTGRQIVPSSNARLKPRSQTTNKSD